MRNQVGGNGLAIGEQAEVISFSGNPAEEPLLSAPAQR